MILAFAFQSKYIYSLSYSPQLRSLYSPACCLFLRHHRPFALLILYIWLLQNNLNKCSDGKLFILSQPETKAYQEGLQFPLAAGFVTG